MPEPEVAEMLTRVPVPELDAILGKPFKCLDDGFIRAVDYMGSDAAIVQAARVSYGKGTKKIHEDRGLIRYLMRHKHTTPFEMCEIKFHIRCPMDCWRQWIRHRTANVNEYSTRYSEAIDSAQRTPADKWRSQATGNRQGSGNFLPPDVGAALSSEEERVQKDIRAVYDKRLEAGVAREQARKDLPLSTYTEAYWKMDLHNLLHFCMLRMDGHAQQEIREFATIIGDQVVKRWTPHAWEAFVDYRLKAVHFTRLEMEIFQMLTRGLRYQGYELATSFGWLAKEDDGKLKTNRERQEFEEKLLRLGLEKPWDIDPDGRLHYRTQ